MIRVLSREPDKSMFGLGRGQSQLSHRSEQFTYFSKDVAREVTQPEWPSRVPRWMSCSAMIAVLRGWVEEIYYGTNEFLDFVGVRCP